MFFALIRGLNSFTNNPTAVQFQSAYKKLLLNNMNITVPASANCLPQDDTSLISNNATIDNIGSTATDAVEDLKENCSFELS